MGQKLETVKDPVFVKMGRRFKRIVIAGVLSIGTYKLYTYLNRNYPEYSRK